MAFLSLAGRTGRSRRGISRRQLMGRPCRVLPRALSRRMLQGSLDSSHRVEVHFVNAPPGMRSGLTKSEGPAEVSVRTQYSHTLGTGSEVASRPFSVIHVRIRNCSSCPPKRSCPRDRGTARSGGQQSSLVRAATARSRQNRPFVKPQPPVRSFGSVQKTTKLFLHKLALCVRGRTSSAVYPRVLTALDSVSPDNATAPGGRPLAIKQTSAAWALGPFLSSTPLTALRR
jgi:hypothetical protein